ncbi:polysaccharide deacetylase family protein [Micromonospora sp. WMMD736]|uniref:polysaccharide deacetylase family protein n=1 Tax=Micromonospora sp. WMMD736 TaxID=3404112 RepID=UPI003B959527
MLRQLISAVALVVVLAVSGCGIELRTPSPAELTSDSAGPSEAQAPVDPYVQPRTAPELPPISEIPLVPAPGQTVVSLTFDDGRASALTAAEIMTKYGLTGTFYVNSGTVGTPDHFTLPDLDAMAAAGHEIGGHTLNHENLGTLGVDEVRRQICDDRVALLQWGFPVRSFAFPFGAAPESGEQAVRECGYNSARGLGGLYSFAADENCRWCEPAEQLPPENPMLTRAPDQVAITWTAADMERLITDAGPGWVQMTFHGVCPSDCDDIGTPVGEFEQFVNWLADQQQAGTLLVSTVGDAIGGPVQPAVSGPVAAPAPPGVNAVVNPGMDTAGVDGMPDCWMRGGFGANTPEFSVVPTGRDGSLAGRLLLDGHIDGAAQWLPTTDLGTCAPSVAAGQRYTLEAWYTATVPTSFTVQYRLARGVWAYGTTSPEFPPASQFQLARWTMPPVPDGVTAISFGLTLTQDGELVTDDYAMFEGESAP